MSKAFTKDDAVEAPVVVTRRLPLPPGTPNYVTPRGWRSLRDQLEALQRPPAAPDATSSAGPRGDLQALAVRRAELEDQVATAVLAPVPVARDEVRFGAHVAIRNAAGGARRIQIVGVGEADPPAGLVAFVAPLARALMGHRAGEIVVLRAPGGEEDLEILSVAYDEDTDA